jgi:hypothetical protein
MRQSFPAALGQSGWRFCGNITVFHIFVDTRMRKGKGETRTIDEARAAAACKPSRFGLAPRLPKSTSPRIHWQRESSPSQRHRQISPDRRPRHKLCIPDKLWDSLCGPVQAGLQPLPVRVELVHQDLCPPLYHTCPSARRVSVVEKTDCWKSSWYLPGLHWQCLRCPDT